MNEKVKKYSALKEIVDSEYKSIKNIVFEVMNKIINKSDDEYQIYIVTDFKLSNGNLEFRISENAGVDLYITSKQLNKLKEKFGYDDCKVYHFTGSLGLEFFDEGG
jgi:hypothetical protein